MDRKLYIINGGHAWAGYMGHLQGYVTMQQIFADAALVSAIRQSMGDGDHGININMSKGFTLAAERLTPAMNMSDAFLLISQILMGETGGSMGPLYGSWFRGLSRVSAERTDLDAAALQMMFDSGLTDLRTLTSAQTGDKTLLDVLLRRLERPSRREHWKTQR